MNRCPSPSAPRGVDQMSLRTARRVEGAAIDENGFYIAGCGARAISSGAWRFKPGNELPTTPPWDAKGRYFPRALPEAIRRTCWGPISSADGDSLEREDCHAKQGRCGLVPPRLFASISSSATPLAMLEAPH